MRETQPNVIVIGGPNGAGKSSLAPYLLPHALNVRTFVNADTIAEGLSAYDSPSVALEAAEIMLHRIDGLASEGVNFAVESTLAGRTLARRLRQWKQWGYRVELFYLWLKDVDLAVSRVRMRVGMGGHDIPESTIRRRYTMSLRHLVRMYLPIADEWLIYDNGGEESRLVVKGASDRKIDVFDEEVWDQITGVADDED